MKAYVLTKVLWNAVDAQTVFFDYEKAKEAYETMVKGYGGEDPRLEENMSTWGITRVKIDDDHGEQIGEVCLMELTVSEGEKHDAR